MKFWERCRFACDMEFCWVSLARAPASGGRAVRWNHLADNPGFKHHPSAATLK